MTNVIKFIIGFALLGILISNSKFNEIFEVFKHINTGLCALSLPLYIFNTYSSSYRWWLLIPESNYFMLLRSNFMLAYYMVFVPGQLVSEGIKGARLVAAGHKAHSIFSSIFIDKLVAFIALMLIGLTGLLTTQHHSLAINSLITVLGLILALLLLILIFGSKTFFILEWLGHLPLMASIPAINKSLVVIEEYFAEYSMILKQRRTNVIKALLVSLVFQGSCILINYVIGLSLGIHISFLDWAWITAILAVVLLLPISIGGIGVREGGLAAMFGLMHLPVEQALSFSFAIYAFTFVSALIGYLVDLCFGLQARGD